MQYQREAISVGFNRKHKIIIGSFSTIIILVIIINSIMLYILYGMLNSNVNKIEDQISNLQKDTQTKFNDLTQTTLQTKKDLNSLNTQLGSMTQEFELLKASTSADFSGIIENAVKSVVTVKTDTGQGTGFLITNDGYIVTNAHVLADARGYLANNIKAVTYDQQELSATYIGYSAQLDIAIIKISGSDYSKVNFANSDNLQIGQKVIAIGNPLGLQFSVSEGIISAINRPGSNDIDAYIQTDAALNPGNSGGPLIDTQGKVVGINNFKISGSENIGFALESNYIIEIVNKISQDKLQKDLI
jgi:S1-C subfamily serine protease